MLTAGHLKITRDERFKIVDDYNLQISNVKTQDAGDYICQIGDQETRDQVHTVEILGKLKSRKKIRKFLLKLFIAGKIYSNCIDEIEDQRIYPNTKVFHSNRPTGHSKSLRQFETVMVKSLKLTYIFWNSFRHCETLWYYTFTSIPFNPKNVVFL